jgi:hypothetical protein
MYSAFAGPGSVMNPDLLEAGPLRPTRMTLPTYS